VLVIWVPQEMNMEDEKKCRAALAIDMNQRTATKVGK